MTDLFGFTIFCDDIRQEVGDKNSLMGCYYGRMNIGAPEPTEGGAPLVLPKLAANVNFIYPMDLRASNLRVVLFMEREGQNAENLLEAFADIDPQKRSGAGDVMFIKFNFVLSPLVVPGPCIIRVRGYFDDQEVRGGALEIAFAPELMAN